MRRSTVAGQLAVTTALGSGTTAPGCGSTTTGRGATTSRSPAARGRPAASQAASAASSRCAGTAPSGPKACTPAARGHRFPPRAACNERLDSRSGAADFVPVHPDLPDASDYGIRLSLTDVKGISGAEVASIVAGQPFSDLADFWSRATVSRPVVERLVLAGAFDAMHGIGATGSGLGRRGRITRRDLLLHVGELDRWERASTGRSSRRRVLPPRPGACPRRSAGHGR